MPENRWSTCINETYAITLIGSNGTMFTPGLRILQDQICGLVDAIFVGLHLLIRLLLRGITFFVSVPHVPSWLHFWTNFILSFQFCPMITDIISAGHLFWYAVYRVAFFVLDVAHIAERTTGINRLIRSAFPSPSLLVIVADQRIVPRSSMCYGAAMFCIIIFFLFFCSKVIP